MKNKMIINIRPNCKIIMINPRDCDDVQMFMDLGVES